MICINHMISNYNLFKITDLENSLNSNSECYIICTLDGNNYDFGIIPSKLVHVEKTQLSIEMEPESLYFDNLDWSTLQVYGDDYDYCVNSQTGFNISFPFQS